MYTFKQSAELANLHENTARNYRDRFLDYFSWTGEGRRRRYSEETILLLTFIAEKVAKNMTQEQIQTELEKKSRLSLNNTPPEDNNITHTRDNSKTLTQFAELVKLAVAKEIRQHDERIEKKIDLLNVSLERQGKELTEAVRTIDLPNVLAHSVQGKKMGMIALILPDILNPFYSAMARGVEDVAHAQGLMVIIGNSNQSVKERSYIKTLKKKHVDGFIFASNTIGEEDLEALRNDGIPIVLLDRGLNTAGCAVIRSKNRQGAKIAVQHLIEQGCERIAHIYGPQEFITARERLLGYEDGVAGLKGYSPSLMVSGQFDIESGRKGVEQILARHPDIDGIFAGNDLMAIGALKALHERGIQVPKQVKVCGFDGISLTEVTQPELTTVAQPIYEMGELAARILLREIESGVCENTVIELDVTLISRKSSEIYNVLEQMKNIEAISQPTTDPTVATRAKALFVMDSPWSSGRACLPKGLNKATLGHIVQFLQATRRPLSVEEVAEGVNLTRVTVRHYLEFLELRGVLKSEQKYGTVGRPVKLFIPL